jgi:hypothetical protein
MALKNYTTSIDADRTASEIAKMLRKAGAAAVLTEYDEKSEYVASLSFKMTMGGKDLMFKLPCDWEGALRAMSEDAKVPRRLCTREQAVRVSWRVVLDWVDAQLAFIQMNQAKAEALFVPFMLMRNGATLSETIYSNPQFLLGNNQQQHET